MVPVFIVVSMIVLGASTMIAVVSNTLIIVVNLRDKVKGKNLSPSDLIVVTLCITNIFFQLVMLINDYMSFVDGGIFFTDEVYILSTILLMLPMYSSFWFTVCLSINYYLQIVISTNQFLIRLKLAASQLMTYLIIASVSITLTTGLPAAWNFHRAPQSFNISSDENEEIIVPRLSIEYLLSGTFVNCTVPLILVGITNGLIIKCLVNHRSDRNSKGELSARAEGRIRAARTISCLLFIYISFYLSEILVFVDVFSQSSPGFCTCLMVMYSYSPAQSIVLIFGSPKLKQVSLSFLRCNREKERIPTVLFISP
ncbi:taste receptor type 2 member 40-like [Aquarana catesbeiana]|uniref:taste receptor type 2 member 40-like n=1 Tax=Aquarana catesbeiana TaxID=8400 RepID=UPI003CC987C1